MLERIDTVAITDETRRRYLNYALSVITNRALPDVRDGLKPVQRRILYAMFHDLHVYSNEKPLKCAKVCGEVMGNYHPHGDMAIYDALVRMTQDWVLRYPLVQGEGNFGSVEGYEAAASRYTECKLRPIAEELMVELRQKTVEMKPTYDGNRQEPTVLPARFPHILVNGSTGIAVGMATNIPPHNLKDVIAACVQLIDDPESTTAVLLDKLKGPDFPLGGKVLADRKTLRTIYEDGQGSIKVQAEWKLEEGKKRKIIVTSIPYGVNKGALEEKIGDLIANRNVPQLLNVVNESNDKDGLRIGLEIKPDADPDTVMAYLFKHTDLQTSFAYNMTCLVPSVPLLEAERKRKKGKKDDEVEESGPVIMRPARASLPEMLRHFLDFRFLTVKRRYEYLLEQLRARIHILEGFRIVFNALDKALELIKTSQGKADAAEKLISVLKLDAIQADAILEMLLYKIARLEIRKILEELREKKEEAERIEALLKSEKKLWGVVRGELEEVAEKHGESARRRTRIVSEEEMPEFDPEAYIVRENTNVVITRDGWIKRVGRLASVEGTRVREGDSVIAVLPGSTHDHAVFFSDDGVAYTMRINEVPASAGYGEPIAKFFRLSDGAKIIGGATADPRFIPAETKPARGDPAGPYLLAATAEGQVLRTPFAPYREASTVKGRMFARLNDKDKVVLAAIALPEFKSIILATIEGRVIHFPINEIPVLSGVGKGVMGIKLDDKDTVLGGAMIRNQNDQLSVETSGGKTMEFYGSREQVSRAGKGFEAVKRSSFTKVVPAAIALVNWEEYEQPVAEKNGKPKGGLFD
jgi:DNA gyrase subunit A